MNPREILAEARGVYETMRDALPEGERAGFEKALTVIGDLFALHDLQRAEDRPRSSELAAGLYNGSAPITRIRVVSIEGSDRVVVFGPWGPNDTETELGVLVVRSGEGVDFALRLLENPEELIVRPSSSSSSDFVAVRPPKVDA